MENFPRCAKPKIICIMATIHLRKNVFYDFAVQGYDLKIKYKGQSYYFMVDIDCVWLSDESFTAMDQKKI